MKKLKDTINTLAMKKGYTWMLSLAIILLGGSIKAHAQTLATTATYYDTICTGNGTPLVAHVTGNAGMVHYLWRGPGILCPQCDSNYVTPTADANYRLIASDSVNADTVYISVFVRNNVLATPSVILSSTLTNNICAGTEVKFKVEPTNGGTTPTYQWKKNGTNVGTNSTTYSTTSLNTNDSVWVVMTSNAYCLSSPTATSNKIGAAIGNGLGSLTLTSDSGNNCSGLQILTLTGASTATNIDWYADDVLIDSTIGETVVRGHNFNSYGATEMIVEPSGNFIVALANSHKIVRLTPGSSSETIIAGNGVSGSTANQLSSPEGIAEDAAGNLYIADAHNNRVQKWAPGATSGVTVAGGNGQGNAANQLYYPTDVHIDASGNIFVFDKENYRVQKWAPGATSGVTVAGGNGSGSAANQFSMYDENIFVDANDTIYIADGSNSRVQKWAPGATSGVTVAGGNGSGSATNQIKEAFDVFVDVSGNIYVSDWENNRVQKWARGATSGVTLAGNNGGYGGGANEFYHPGSIQFDAQGDFYVLDFQNDRIQKFQFTHKDTIEGPSLDGEYYAVATMPGGCLTVSNSLPIDTFVGGAGYYNLSIPIIASSNSICSGNKVTFQFTGTNLFTDAIYQWQKNAQVVGTNSSVYIDSTLNNGDVITASVSNHGCQNVPIVFSDTILMRVNDFPDTALLVDSGSLCVGNAQLTLAEAYLPREIEWHRDGATIDNKYAKQTREAIAGGHGFGPAPNQLTTVEDIYMVGDTLYVADESNGRIQKWAPGSTAGVTVVSGVAPKSIMLDGAGNLYVGTYKYIHKFVAGSNTGIVVATSTHYFYGMCMDGMGNIFAVDDNDRVLKYAPGDTVGVIVAGGNGAGSAANQLNGAVGVWVDANNNLFVLDQLNGRVQKFTPGSTSGITVAGSNNPVPNTNGIYQLHYPTHFYFDSNQDIYITNRWDYPYNQYGVIKWVQGDTIGTNVVLDAYDPVSIAAGGLSMDSHGNLIVVDASNYSIDRLSPITLDTALTPIVSGTYNATVYYHEGCPVLTNAITIDDLIHDTLSVTIQQGQSYDNHTVTGIYVDTVQSTTNGCDTVRALNLTVLNPNDSIVWPGDANSDGQASIYDVLALGLAYADTGSVRPNANNSWTGQLCPTWANSFATGVNHNHADCDGNGVVNADDTVPILLNYGLTHQKTGNQRNTPGAPLLYFDTTGLDSLAVNTAYSVPLDLGLAPDTVQGSYGIAFTIAYDSGLVQPSTANFIASPSWLGSLGNDLMSVQHSVTPGLLDVAITRINHTPRSGLGIIGLFGFVTIDNLSGKDFLVDTIHLSVNNIRMIDEQGVEHPVNTAANKLEVYQQANGIALNGQQPFQVSIFPNPTTGMVNYTVIGLRGKADYQLTDITGRAIKTGSIQPGNGITTGQIDLQGLSKGIYLIRIGTEQGIVTQKIVLQ